MKSVPEQVRMLRDEAGLAVLDRDVILARGEAEVLVPYLQGQVSQEITDLAAGQSRWSFILQPQGKVDAWFRISRLADSSIHGSTFVLDVDGGWGEALITRLERFRLRTPVTFEQVAWTVTAVRGAMAPLPGAPVDPARGLVVPVEWPGERGWDLIGDGDLTSELPRCSAEAMEVLRIEAGRPRMGHELDSDTIPAEAGVVPQSVSFTKGCYTGQELVARIDSRGSQTPRRLVGVRIQGDLALDVGDELEIDGAAVGRLTSVAPVGSDGAPVALAYLKRGVETPAEVTITTGGAPKTAMVMPLPLATMGSA